ncbi:MAG: hypothetical protein CV087_16710 [Candidatus Brocadia sp. WS118]|nr:MAG: hypothetical protein CV087_16710 [Candidatus Brocadia sp. WS118]
MQHKHFGTPINISLLLILILLSCSNESVPVKEDKVNSSFENGFEIRWFYQGRLDAKVSEWFNNQSHFQGNASTEERTELYLITTGNESISPKFRGGKARLELKSRTGQKDFISCDNTLSGRIESWQKWEWGFLEDKQQEVRNAFLETSKGKPRVEVYKKRQQRKFKIAEDGSTQAVDMEERLDTGCLLEITELKVNGEDWWTLAFDVFSDQGNAVELFRKSICQILQDYPVKLPEVKDSYAYPAWLAKIVGSQESEGSGAK